MPKRRLNVSLIAIIGEGLLSRLSFGLISFTLPLYARHLGLSLAEVGVLAALNSAVAVGLKPIAGWAADRFGLKRTYLASIGVRSLVSFLLSLASAPWALFAIRTAHGVSMSMRDPSANALIAEHGSEKSVASAFAWYQTARSVAGSVSRAFAGILLTITAANYSLVFLVAFALSVLPLLAVALYVQDADVHAQREESTVPAEPVRPPKVMRFAGLGFMIAASAEMLNGLFPVLATEYAGLSNAETGLIYAISTCATIFSGPGFGWLSDNVSRKLVLTARGIANTLSSVLYVVSPTFAGVAVAKTADDMGKAAFRPAWGALMAYVSSFDKRKRAQTMSWMSMGEDAGGALAPVLAGFLWATWGIAALMGTRVLLAVAAEAYALLITRTAEERPVSRARSAQAEPRSIAVLANSPADE
jgi:MFS family permease